MICHHPYHRRINMAASKAVVLNNQGAHYLKMEQHALAISCLTAALKESKKGTQQTTRPDQLNGPITHPNQDARAIERNAENGQSSSSTDYDMPLLDTIMLNSRFWDTPNPNNRTNDIETSREIFSHARSQDEPVEINSTDLYRGLIYNHPIFVPPTITESASPAEGRQPQPEITISTAIIFNLALAHHLQVSHGHFSSPVASMGLSEECKRAHQLRLLARASQLYDLAYQLQAEQTSGSQMLFLMAVLNNRGLIASLQKDDLCARSCFDHLLSVIMYTVVLGTPQNPRLPERSIHRVPEDTLDGFLRSALSIIPELSNAAAAA